MKNLRNKFILIALVSLAGLLAIFPPQDKLKPGIDLSGGTILVYQVERAVDAGTRPQDPNQSQDGDPAQASSGRVPINELIASLKKRINPHGMQDVIIRETGGNRLEIVLPRATTDEVEQIKRRMTDVGSLEFRILANRHRWAREIEELERQKDETRLPAFRDANRRNSFKFIKIADHVEGKDPETTTTTITDLSQNWDRNAFSRTTVTLQGRTSAESKTLTSKTIPVLRNTSNTLYLTQPHGLAAVESYSIDYNPSELQPGDPTQSSTPYIRSVRKGPGHTVSYALAYTDRFRVTGEYLSSVRKEQDEGFRNAVGFNFNSSGARKFGGLTREFKPADADRVKFHLAIVLDDLVMSAPVINDVIKDSGVIQGGQNGFSEEEINYLINILRSGSLPASINPTPLFEQTIGPTLGDDTIAKGMRAIFISMLLVPIFMIVYYHKAGMVSVIALILNMVLLLGSMALFEATFTLPGLAALSLTIGMAVDANILIYERMREEAERGAGLLQQIRNGFGRAWTTIFDSHVTTILSGVVLAFVGTEEVKGFAIGLILGLIWNLFTAVFVSKAIFDLMTKQRWLTKITLFRLFKKTNVNFTGIRWYCLVGSWAVIAVGLITVALLGKQLLGIDFTGGSLATVRLKDQTADLKTLAAEDRAAVEAFTKLSDSGRVALVREKAEILPDVTVESLRVETEQTQHGHRYNIRTTQQDLDKVRSEIIKAFGPLLAKVDVQIAGKEAIAATEKDPNPRFAAKHLLNLSVPLEPSRVGELFALVLEGKRKADGMNTGVIENPESHFEVARAKAEANATADTPTTSIAISVDSNVPDAKIEELAKIIPNDPALLFERTANISGVVAGETQGQALIAIVASWVIIGVYLRFRFREWIWGIAAIVALIHDALFTLAFVAFAHYLALIPGLNTILLIEPFKIDLPMIAAFLTLIGFSVNDTIVVFDRIREIRGKSPHVTEEIVNTSINMTLSRTVLTSFTAFLVVFILYIFGGEGVHGFAYCMMIGVIVGTYSSIYIAAPIVIDFIRFFEAKKMKTPTPVAKPAGGSSSKSQPSLVKS